MDLDSRTMMSLLESKRFAKTLGEQSGTDELAERVVAQIKHLNGYQRTSPHYQPNWDNLRELLKKYFEAHPETIETYLPEKQLATV